MLPSLSALKRPGHSVLPLMSLLYLWNPYRFNILVLVYEDIWEEIKRDFFKKKHCIHGLSPPGRWKLVQEVRG